MPIAQGMCSDDFRFRGIGWTQLGARVFDVRKAEKFSARVFSESIDNSGVVSERRGKVFAEPIIKFDEVGADGFVDPYVYGIGDDLIVLDAWTASDDYNVLPIVYVAKLGESLPMKLCRGQKKLLISVLTIFNVAKYSQVKGRVWL